MGLQLRATVRDRGLDLEIGVGDHEVVALLGSNGAGKSTVLSLVAGLLSPDTGRATLDDRVLFDVDRSGAGPVWVPPHARGVALLAQEPLLFPHLSALDNVAFGPRSAGRSRGESRAVARHWLAEVDATSYAERRPAQLSGGQAQRVAVARALAADPGLLLLDEPLRRVLAGRSVVLVTHDVLDALLLADRVVVLEAGRVVEDAPTARVLARPSSAFAARIAGLNMVRGRVDGQGVRSPDGLRVEGIAEDGVTQGQAAVAVFRPSAVGVYRRAPGGSPRNVLDVTVTELEPHGDQIRVRGGDLSADVTAAAAAELDLAPGTAVVFSVKASEVAVYPG
jgi:molybdate transport system ATP-binding protein